MGSFSNSQCSCMFRKISENLHLKIKGHVTAFYRHAIFREQTKLNPYNNIQIT